jgi:hypothetical protein
MYVHTYTPCLGQCAHDDAVGANMVLVRVLAAARIFELNRCVCGNKYENEGA